MNDLCQYFSILALVFLFSACSEQAEPGEETIKFATYPADVVYTNGRIYTVTKTQPWAEAVAIKAGQFIAVGNDADVQEFIGAQTEMIDLAAKFVMPGIHDMHVHPQQAGEKYHFQCGFPFSYSMDQIIARLTECVANTPKGEWIIGGQWANELLASATVPNKKILDAISTEHPIHLGDSTVHAAWLNSMALAALGISADTANPNGGTIVREPGSTEPTGVLFDNAYYETFRQIPRYSEEQYETALLWSMREMNKVGITSIKDAFTESDALAAYKRLDDNGRLTMKVAASIGWNMAWTDTPEQERENRLHRARYAGVNINADFAKIMLDGIPPQRTAAMLAPYLPDEVHGDNYRGKLIHSADKLAAAVVEMDSLGLTVKIHATGDRSLRVALDAFEQARKLNGDSGLIHEVSHAELIHPDDLQRFKALNVAAEMCPILWYPSPLVSAMEEVIGPERSARFWQVKSLSDAGALVIYGSDWPSVVPDPNPWPGLEAMVTRKNPYTNSAESLAAEQAVDIATAIQIFTRNGAIAGKRQDKTGTIEVGKQADFIILDKNLFTVPVEDISEVQVLTTVVDGKKVYVKEQ